jgi:hypothetical protein
MYKWFGSVFDEGVPYSRHKAAEWWRPDGKMITNGKELYVGFDSLNDHWEAMKAHFKSLKIDLPFIEYIEADDKVVIEYTIKGTTKSGADGVVHDLAVFYLVDGKIAKMREVAHFEGFGGLRA